MTIPFATPDTVSLDAIRQAIDEAEHLQTIVEIFDCEQLANDLQEFVYDLRTTLQQREFALPATMK